MLPIRDNYPFVLRDELHCDGLPWVPFRNRAFTFLESVDETIVWLSIFTSHCFSMFNYSGFNLLILIFKLDLQPFRFRGICPMTTFPFAAEQSAPALRFLSDRGVSNRAGSARFQLVLRGCAPHWAPRRAALIMTFIIDLWF